MIFPRDYFEMMIWINIYVCFPLTFLFIPLCFMVRLDHIPVSHYINLLISNLIPIISLMFFKNQMRYFYYSSNDYLDHPNLSRYFVLYRCSGVVSVCFRMIFAVERFHSLSRPQFHFMKTTKGFVSVCVLAWMLCIILFCTLIYFYKYTTIPVIFFAIMFIVLLAFIIESLCVATSVPAEEKYRVVGTLVLLLVNYSVMIQPMIVYVTSPSLFDPAIKIFFTFCLQYPLMDFFLLAFMSKGPFVRLLMGLCCRRRNPAETDSSEPAV